MAALAKTENKSLRDLLDLNEAINLLFNYYDNQVKANEVEYETLKDAAEIKRRYYSRAKLVVFDKLEEIARREYEENLA